MSADKKHVLIISGSRDETPKSLKLCLPDLLYDVDVKKVDTLDQLKEVDDEFHNGDKRYDAVVMTNYRNMQDKLGKSPKGDRPIENLKDWVADISKEADRMWIFDKVLGMEGGEQMRLQAAGVIVVNSGAPTGTQKLRGYSQYTAQDLGDAIHEVLSLKDSPSTGVTQR